MTKVRTWAGLDVHAASTVACLVDGVSGELSVRRLPGRTSEVAAFCSQLPAPVSVAYEAGPTGFELARVLDAAGVGCVVAARGIDTLSAVGLCAEIGDFARFESPAKLMHYLGLMPSENSSGQTRRQGAITKTGSRHARRLLVEAAWHYRRPPRKGTTLQRRHEGQSAQTIAISWKAQQRLYHVWQASTASAGNARHSSRAPSPTTSPASAGRSPTATRTLGPTPNRRPSAEEAAESARQPARARASAVAL